MIQQKPAFLIDNQKAGFVFNGERFALNVIFFIPKRKVFFL